MNEELEKTCENCEYEYESCEGEHCRHCIHSATENFKPKEKVMSEKEIRAKAIDEFAEKLIKHISQMPSGYIGSGNVLIIAEQMKAGADNE